MQRNKNSSAPDRKLQSHLRKNVVDAVKQAVEKLLKAELLQNEHEHAEESSSQAGGDDEDVTLADKIQAEVVGADTKADGHALAGGDMDEGDNIVPPEADDDDDGGDDGGDSGLEEEQDMKGSPAEDQQQNRDDDADDAAANKEKKQKTATKPGEGDAKDVGAAAVDGEDVEDGEDDAAANSGVIIGTNEVMEVDEDLSQAFDADSAPLQVAKRSDNSGRGEDDVLREWQAYSMEAAVASRELCEALRLILEPTLASKMHGDFKTGKRINMRKVWAPIIILQMMFLYAMLQVIPYIASSFRRDRIWLRRAAPQKRAYQIVVCVDNSSSMKSKGAKQPALNSLAMIWNALQQLEVGQVGVFGFDVEPKLLHPLDAPLTESAGAALLQSLSFDADVLFGGAASKSNHSSDFALLLDRALGYLDDCKASSSKSGSSSELQQVTFAAKCRRHSVSRQTLAAFIHCQRRLRACRPKEARELPKTKRQTLFIHESRCFCLYLQFCPHQP